MTFKTGWEGGDETKLVDGIRASMRGKSKRTSRAALGAVEAMAGIIKNAENRKPGSGREEVSNWIRSAAAGPVGTVRRLSHASAFCSAMRLVGHVVVHSAST